jgi:asparagine synthase (glutamine-hydrolysing)
MLGHRRLSILDLTPGGHQPMFNDDGSLAIVYNGEIYNYLELRRSLEQQGATFRSQSDTEVLLKAYEAWGTEAFSRFNGMWAFTIWDGRQKKLLACRDRFGVKPLYYTQVDGIWAFASEIKALLAYPGAFRGFRNVNIERFVRANATDGDDSTMFRDIWAISPGTYIELDAGGATARGRYWRLTIDGRYERDSPDLLAERYRELLKDAVRLRLRSDVPIGTMLSGGLDSTSITALIREHRPAPIGADITTGDPDSPAGFHHTFTACWPGWRGDEEAEVTAFCANLGLESHKFYLTAEGLAAAIDKVIYHLYEPFSNPTSLVQYLLMGEARRYGVKVVLNGHGSDEALAGYQRFIPPYLAQLLLSAHPLSFVTDYRAFKREQQFSNRRILDLVLGGLRGRAGRTAVHPPADNSAQGETDQRLMSYFARPETLAGSKQLTLLGSELWAVFSTHTLPKWLRMEDRVSMARSIESRLPFLDFRLVEMAFNLPDDLKLKGGLTKVVLRKAMSDHLPPSIVANRQKRRFSTPFGQWFRGAWRPLLEEHLREMHALRDHMETRAMRDDVGRFLAGRGQAIDPETIWRALSTELFLNVFAKPPSEQPESVDVIQQPTTATVASG